MAGKKRAAKEKMIKSEKVKLPIPAEALQVQDFVLPEDFLKEMSASPSKVVKETTSARKRVRFSFPNDQTHPRLEEFEGEAEKILAHRVNDEKNIFKIKTIDGTEEEAGWYDSNQLIGNKSAWECLIRAYIELKEEKTPDENQIPEAKRQKPMNDQKERPSKRIKSAMKK